MNNSRKQSKRKRRKKSKAQHRKEKKDVFVNGAEKRGNSMKHEGKPVHYEGAV